MPINTPPKVQSYHATLMEERLVLFAGSLVGVHAIEITACDVNSRQLAARRTWGESARVVVPIHTS